MSRTSPHLFRHPLALSAALLSAFMALPSAQAQSASSASAPARMAPASASAPAPKDGPGFWQRWTGRDDGPRGERRDGRGRHDRHDDRDRGGRAEPHEDLVERTQQRLAHLKVDLKITAAQDKAWSAYVAQATRQAEAAKVRFAKLPDREAREKLSAPERMALRTAALKQRVADEEAIQPAFKALYATLTPEQQKRVEREVGRGHGRGGRHGR